jgi:CDP-diacylglycerol--glycerol-3-phosphate 3-phosphatidyltransferase
VSTARAVPAPLARIPNALTLARVVLIPVFVAIMLTAQGGRSWPAAIVFGVAAITDQIDGWLARRWQVESEFGKLVDPLADRLMIDAAVLLLVFQSHRLPWAALVIPLRDVVLVGGFTLVASRGYELSVSVLGKAATWILYLALSMVMVTHDGASWPLVLFWAGFGLAAVTAVLYVVRARREVAT